MLPLQEICNNSYFQHNDLQEKNASLELFIENKLHKKTHAGGGTSGLTSAGVDTAEVGGVAPNELNANIPDIVDNHTTGMCFFDPQALSSGYHTHVHTTGHIRGI